MTRFWLVRHGPTHAKAMVGWTDLAADLSDTAAIGRLRDHLPRSAPVISSDLARAVATADALCPHLRLPHDPGLREMHFGQWEMRGFAEVEAEDSALIRAFWDSPGDIRPPGGESWNDLATRTSAALDRLQGTAPDIIVVAHFGPILAALHRVPFARVDAVVDTNPARAPILAALQRALRVPAIEVFANRIDNLSVTCLCLTPAEVFAINHRP